MRVGVAVGCLLVSFAPAPRPPDIPFRIHTIDPGASETVAVADINHDGRLDIVSGEFWYDAPSWTKHRFRELNFLQQYIDDFSDLAVDVDRDGYPDIVSVSWFAKQMVWWRNDRGLTRTNAESPVARNSISPDRSVARNFSSADRSVARNFSSADHLWPASVIHSGFNIEFAILADIDNDGKANEVVAQENGTGQAWYEAKNGAFVAHVVSDRSYGHGIGAGDVNKDGRTDILTPRGWLEAPADPRSGKWAFHPDWETTNVTQGGPDKTAPASAASATAAPRVTDLGFMHVVDVNGDGRNDVVAGAAHDYGVFWYEHTGSGPWVRHTIDSAWSQAHASTLVDLNGDGRMDLVTGKRFMAHNGNDPGEREPLGLYWYEFRSPRESPPSGVEWVRHIIDYGGRVGGGMQIPAVDMDGDGDLDLVCGGKSGLFLIENLSRRNTGVQEFKR